MLAERHADDTEPEPQVTAQEWIAAHRTAVVEDERHRDVTDEDVTDDRPDAADYQNVPAAGDDDPARVDVVLPDLRAVAAAEPAQVAEDVVRVPSAAQVADAIERANRVVSRDPRPRRRRPTRESRASGRGTRPLARRRPQRRAGAPRRGRARPR